MSSSKGTIRILIVDATPHSRDNLAAYLQLQERLEVLGVASGASEAFQLARQQRPDVVIMATHLPDMDGFTAARRLMELEAAPAVILLALHGSDQEQQRAQEAGAVAYIEKSGGVDLILDALQSLSITTGANASPGAERPETL